MPGEDDVAAALIPLQAGAREPGLGLARAVVAAGILDPRRPLTCGAACLRNAILQMSTGNGNPTPAAPPTAQATTIKPTDLRGILQYVPRFQGQIFVIAIDGSIVADENFGNLLVDIAVLRSLGIKVVLVHGIGHRPTEELARALRGVARSPTATGPG